MYVTAPGARPTTPKQLLARNQAGKSNKSSKKSLAKNDDEAEFEAFCQMQDKLEKQQKQREKQEKSMAARPEQC